MNQQRKAFSSRALAVVAAGACAALAFSGTAAAWEPTKPVTIVVPAGTGGGADQMARFIQGVVSKHHLMKEPIIVVNESGGAGAQGFLDVKGSKGDPEKLIITLSNLFTTPLATGVPFSYKDFTPVAMLALDEFVLWVNADTPYKTAMEYVDAVKKEPGKFKMGGTGSKQEDQIVTAEIEQKTGAKFTYLPFKGGGAVAVQLVGGHVDSTVNNPIEAVAQWRAGKLRPLCVFDSQRMPYNAKVTSTMSWHDIPTCKEAGLPVEYLMLRGFFLPPGVSQDAVNFYIDLFKKVRETPDWKEFTEQAAFNQSFMTGAEFVKWLGNAETMHRELMEKAGFLATK
ncbi:MAG: tripartite tricarboxylate transporter substrate binding protein [Proteobacteria bacterium]|jgi:tripartite-type tricarboxylate transporter receptor subunit TctC|nr:tripartite tricarboxylate transporter substrate binding protein [Pseudomonadota bacterium]